jgi:hypothetical protein
LCSGVSGTHCRADGREVIVATQPERGDCGTSITNIWDECFFLSLQNLPEVATAGSALRWFEHYHGTRDPEIDEVFLTREERVNSKFGAKGLVPVAAAFERVTGEPEPDFAATGFEQQMAEKMYAGACELATVTTKKEWGASDNCRVQGLR